MRMPAPGWALGGPPRWADASPAPNARTSGETRTAMRTDMMHLSGVAGEFRGMATPFYSVRVPKGYDIGSGRWTFKRGCPGRLASNSR